MKKTRSVWLIFLTVCMCVAMTFSVITAFAAEEDPYAGAAINYLLEITRTEDKTSATLGVGLNVEWESTDMTLTINGKTDDEINTASPNAITFSAVENKITTITFDLTKSIDGEAIAADNSNAILKWDGTDTLKFEFFGKSEVKAWVPNGPIKWAPKVEKNFGDAHVTEISKVFNQENSPNAGGVYGGAFFLGFDTIVSPWYLPHAHVPEFALLRTQPGISGNYTDGVLGYLEQVDFVPALYDHVYINGKNIKGYTEELNEKPEVWDDYNQKVFIHGAPGKDTGHLIGLSDFTAKCPDDRTTLQISGYGVNFTTGSNMTFEIKEAFTALASRQTPDGTGTEFGYVTIQPCKFTYIWEDGMWYNSAPYSDAVKVVNQNGETVTDPETVKVGDTLTIDTVSRHMEHDILPWDEYSTLFVNGKPFVPGETYEVTKLPVSITATYITPQDAKLVCLYGNNPANIIPYEYFEDGKVKSFYYIFDNLLSENPNDHAENVSAMAESICVNDKTVEEINAEKAGSIQIRTSKNIMIITFAEGVLNYDNHDTIYLDNTNTSFAESGKKLMNSSYVNYNATIDHVYNTITPQTTVSVERTGENEDVLNITDITTNDNGDLTFTIYYTDKLARLGDANNVQNPDVTWQSEQVPDKNIFTMFANCAPWETVYENVLFDGQSVKDLAALSTAGTQWEKGNVVSISAGTGAGSNGLTFVFKLGDAAAEIFKADVTHSLVIAESFMIFDLNSFTNVVVPAGAFTYNPEAATGEKWDVVKYNLTLEGSNEAAVDSFTGNGEYEAYATVLAYAKAKPGYVFKNWTIKGTDEVVSENASFQFQLVEDVTLVANFEKTYKITIPEDVQVKVGNRTIKDGAYLEQGTTIRISAEKSGYSVKTIKINGQEIENGAVYNVGTEDIVIEVTFKEISKGGCSSTVSSNGYLMMAGIILMAMATVIVTRRFKNKK